MTNCGANKKDLEGDMANCGEKRDLEGNMTNGGVSKKHHEGEITNGEGNK